MNIIDDEEFKKVEIIEENTLCCCDNLNCLKKIKSNSIKMIYCDILYATGRKFKNYKDLKCDRNVITEHYIPRLTEMFRILKKDGSIYLQMDTKINHWLRIIMDDIFGYDNFLNEISWCYKSGSSSNKKWSEKHDVIIFYSKDKKEYKHNITYEKELSSGTAERYGKEIEKNGGFFINIKKVKNIKYRDMPNAEIGLK